MSNDNRREMDRQQRRKRRKRKGTVFLVQLIIEIILLLGVLLIIASGVLALKGIHIPVVSNVAQELMAFNDSDTGRTPSQNPLRPNKDKGDGNSKFQFLRHQDVELHDYSQYILLGDSRFVGMRDVITQDKDVYICEVGMGYYWMLEQLDDVRNLVASNSDTALILELGVNDLENSDLYIEKANQLAQELNCRMYYLTVNPVDEGVEARLGYDITNSEIEVFNQNLVDYLDDSIVIIDTNSYLHNIGFETLDGLHYTDETYMAIYEFVKDNVQSR